MEKDANVRKRFNRVQVIQNLIIIVLVLLIIFLLTKMPILLQSLSIAMNILFLPLILAAFLYYILLPFVNFLMKHFGKRGLSRSAASLMALVVAVIVIVIIVAIFIPIIQEQVDQMIKMVPIYIDNAQVYLNENVTDQMFFEVNEWLIEFNVFETLRDSWKNIVSVTIGSISSVVGAVAKIVVSLLTAPIVLFYLLKDDGTMIESFLNVFPTQKRPAIHRVLSEIDDQLSGYIRGQMMVALLVGISFWILFSIIGLDYALTLGVLSGMLNLIPYLGSFLAMIPALIIAAFISPFMLLKTLLAFAIEQIIEGRVIQPYVLGSNINVHPITILFILLVAGAIGGLGGVVLGIPIYASVKVLITHLFRYYRKHSLLYEESGL